MSEAAAPDELTRRVRPWIAALLSLVVAGLGHFYARRPLGAAVWIAIWLGVLAGTVAALDRFEEVAWLVLVPAMLLLFFVQLKSAFDAARARPRVTRGGPRRLLGYAAIVAAMVLAGFAFDAALPVRAYFVASGSMMPTLLPGDRILVRVRSPLCRAIAFDRGDVILARTAVDGVEQLVIRRIAGLPGDRVAVGPAGLNVNSARITSLPVRTRQGTDARGRPALFYYAEERIAGSRPWTAYGHGVTDWGREYQGVVPEGHVFTLGDNRAASFDSRMDGPIPIDAIEGRVLRVSFSLSKQPSPPWRDVRVREGPSCASS